MVSSMPIRICPQCRHMTSHSVYRGEAKFAVTRFIRKHSGTPVGPHREWRCLHCGHFWFQGIVR